MQKKQSKKPRLTLHSLFFFLQGENHMNRCYVDRDVDEHDRLWVRK